MLRIRSASTATATARSPWPGRCAPGWKAPASRSSPSCRPPGRARHDRRARRRLPALPPGRGQGAAGRVRRDGREGEPRQGDRARRGAGGRSVRRLHRGRSRLCQPSGLLRPGRDRPPGCGGQGLGPDRRGAAVAAQGALREVEVCYDADLAPDLAAVAEASGLTPEEVVAAHLRGDYGVSMYGFAPGCAYLAGVPEEIRLPRKQAAIRGVPAGSVIIAGPQCLVTTLTMPTGWWIVGRSPTRILREEDADRPFLFDVGDRVRFRRIAREAFDARAKP
ncbi:MAG: hypothetical protein DCC69_11055 [Hyphomicrobiales bacterium]|nr:MAG: hypothetical protein DCC69_11055 [Hyphomicrobiales bacterium]